MSQLIYENDIRIIEATPRQIPLLRNLGEQTFREAYAEDTDAKSMELYLEKTFTIANVEADFDNPKTKFLLASYDSVWAGYALLRWDRSHELLEGAATMMLHRIYVLKDFWRQKIGSILLKHIIDFAKTQGYEWLWLVVWDQNLRAVNFYQKWGFEHFGYEKFHFGEEINDDWAMRLKL
ncbi:MAG: GNAT family N-acetyltransferase [Saprospiraceae bacterium]|nr:GNAT family N-acetyltransferase [Saprospiraceae bacterium]